MRLLVAAAGVALGLLTCLTRAAKPEKPAAPAAPKAGIKTPGIQIPVQALKPEAEIMVETPGWPTVAEAVFIPNRSKDTVLRAEAKTAKPLEPLAGLNKPCAGTVFAFGNLWVPNCGSQALVRFDTKTNKSIATIQTG